VCIEGHQHFVDTFVDTSESLQTALKLNAKLNKLTIFIKQAKML